MKGKQGEKLFQRKANKERNYSREKKTKGETIAGKGKQGEKL
jgi:hypothetical protein